MKRLLSLSAKYSPAALVPLISACIFFGFLFLLSTRQAFTEETQASVQTNFTFAPQEQISNFSTESLLGFQKDTRWVERYFADRTGGQSAVSVDEIADDAATPINATSSDLISDVAFYFSVSNPTRNPLSLLTIPTGIKQGTLHYIRIEGATGYTWENGELVIAYVSLPPGGSTIVTVTGLPLISEHPITLDIAPKIRLSDGQIIAQNALTHRIIPGKRADIVRSFQMSGQSKIEPAVVVATTSAPVDDTAMTTDTTSR